MSTKRDMAINLGGGALTGAIYAVLVIVADFGHDAFYIGGMLAVAIAAIVTSELTDHGEPRRFRLLRRARQPSGAKR